MDFNQIQELIRMVSKHKISEFSLKEGEFKLLIRNQGTIAEAAAPVVVTAAPPVMAMPVAAPSAPMQGMKGEAPTMSLTATEPAGGKPTADANQIAIKSPMVGTFYRSAGPDKPAFVKIGDIVDIGSKVCIIEAMKLFNEIDSEVKGKIVKILVEDASPVEYDQPLFLVEAV